MQARMFRSEHISVFASWEQAFFTPETGSNFSARMGNSICHNVHQVIDELPCLKIFRAPHPPHSSDMSPCDCWMFEDFKGKLKEGHLQEPEEILTAFQEL
jgi:hypothetical protein